MSGVLLLSATFMACIVEMVEALTIILAVGITRSWRSALIGGASGALARGNPVPPWFDEGMAEWAATEVVGEKLTEYADNVRLVARGRVASAAVRGVLPDPFEALSQSA